MCILDAFLSGFTIYFYVFRNFLVYSLNLVLCLHLAINSLLLFNNLSGHLCVKICIFSSKHKLHLPYSKKKILYICIYICVCGGV